MAVSLDVEKARTDIEAYLSGNKGGVMISTHDADVIRRQHNSKPKGTWTEFFRHFRQWQHGKILLGTAGSWFLIDIAFWGLGLNNSSILRTIGFASSKNVYENLYNTAVGNLILSVAGNIPGYWVSVATIDSLGRKPIQIAGFIILTIIFCVIGFAFHSLSSHALLALYVLAQFFSNFGPNSTTFIGKTVALCSINVSFFELTIVSVPGEVFPTQFRSTAHGLSAGAGKTGAVIAQALLGPLQNIGGSGAWLNHVMEIFAAFMVCGVATSLLIPETKRKSLEELAKEHHNIAE